MSQDAVSYTFEKNLVAFCGIYCRECAYYRNIFGHRANDLLNDVERHKWVKTVWESLNAPFDTEQLIAGLRWLASSGGCLGCLAGAGWPECPIRRCAQAKEVRGCSDCGDYPCDTISVEEATHQRELIEKIRAAGLERYIRTRRGETKTE